MTKVTKGQDGRKLFTWVVKISVSETWVEDGFDLDDDRALAMIQKDLGYANEYEYAAKVINTPPRGVIRTAQGYRPERASK